MGSGKIKKHEMKMEKVSQDSPTIHKIGQILKHFAGAFQKAEI